MRRGGKNEDTRRLTGGERRENFKNTITPAYVWVQKMLILLTQLHRTPAYARVTKCFSTPCPKAKPAIKAGFAEEQGKGKFQEDIAGVGQALVFWFQGAFARIIAMPQLLVIPA
jgi:hypothetical protein